MSEKEEGERKRDEKIGGAGGEQTGVPYCQALYQT
jgi:hypothetical protein